jgi:hypothetical protein
MGRRGVASGHQESMAHKIHVFAIVRLDRPAQSDEALLS